LAKHRSKPTRQASVPGNGGDFVSAATTGASLKRAMVSCFTVIEGGPYPSKCRQPLAALSPAPAFG
jgi:hypothetical protein